MNLIDSEDGPSAASGPYPSPMAAALDFCYEALRSGRCVDRKALLTEHAEVADQLADSFDALDLLQPVAGELTPVLGPETDRSPLEHGDVLGDFRIPSRRRPGRLSHPLEATSASRPLAARLRRWVEENP